MRLLDAAATTRVVGNDEQSSTTKDSRPHASIQYLAGYFDGEGCITIMKCGGRNQSKNNPCLRIAIVSSDDDVLKQFALFFGHPIHVPKNNYGVNSKRKLFRWSLDGARAAAALRILEPELIAKREQARAVLSIDWETKANGQPDSEALSKQRWLVKEELKRLKSLDLLVRQGVSE